MTMRQIVPLKIKGGGRSHLQLCYNLVDRLVVLVGVEGQVPEGHVGVDVVVPVDGALANL